MKAIKLTVTVLTALLLSSYANAQTEKKTQTTTSESTSASDTTATDPATTDTTRTQTTTTEEKSNDDKIDKGGLFIEPLLTYEEGEVEISYPAPLNSSTEDIKGAGLGLRFGGHVYQSLFLAVDGRYSKLKYKSSALGEEGDGKASNVGATLGLQTPIAGLRVWGTYILTGSLDPDKINNVDVKFEDLRGYRVGAGLYVAAVSINLEYQDATYNKTTIEDAPLLPANSTINVDPKQKSYHLSVSFPIAL